MSPSLKMFSQDRGRPVKERLAGLDKRAKSWTKLWLAKGDEEGSPAFDVPLEQLNQEQYSNVSHFSDDQLRYACFNKANTPCCEAICINSGLRCHNPQQMSVLVGAKEVEENLCVVGPREGDLTQVAPTQDFVPKGAMRVKICKVHFQSLRNADMGHAQWMLSKGVHLGVSLGLGICITTLIMPHIIAAVPIMAATAGTLTPFITPVVNAVTGITSFLPYQSAVAPMVGMALPDGTSLLASALSPTSTMNRITNYADDKLESYTRPAETHVYRGKKGAPASRHAYAPY